MPNATKNVVLHALIEDVLNDLYPKTIGQQVFVEADKDLITRLQEIVDMFEEYAKTAEMTSAISTAIEALKNELMGEDVNETYNTFKEIADYITEHTEAYEALQALANGKVDNTTFEEFKGTLGTLSTKDNVTEEDLDETLKAKVHTHSNQETLDKITEDTLNKWNNEATIYYTPTKPEALTTSDLWVEILLPVGQAAFDSAKKDYGAFGKAEDMYDGDLTQTWDGSKCTVKGTLKKLSKTTYTKLSEDGYYFAFKLNDADFEGQPITVTLSNEKTSNATDWVILVTDDSKSKPLTVEVGDQLIATYDISALTLKPEDGA